MSKVVEKKFETDEQIMERILVNDRKPEHGNIDTAFAWNVDRDAGYQI